MLGVLTELVVCCVWFDEKVLTIDLLTSRPSTVCKGAASTQWHVPHGQQKATRKHFASSDHVNLQTARLTLFLHHALAEDRSSRACRSLSLKIADDKPSGVLRMLWSMCAIARRREQIFIERPASGSGREQACPAQLSINALAVAVPNPLLSQAPARKPEHS